MLLSYIFFTSSKCTECTNVAANHTANIIREYRFHSGGLSVPYLFKGVHVLNYLTIAVKH